MFKKMLFIILIFLLIFISYFFVGSAPQAKEIKWGINFSQKQAKNLGLDWRKAYLALFEDLKVKDVKLATYWDLIEMEEGKYNFEDLDWQIKTAEEKGADLLLVIGMKTPRWPECHIPEWAKGLNKGERQEKVLELINQIILKYRDSASIWAWQVENEPFFPFGECQKVDKNFLKKEIKLVKSLDIKARPVLISDSGEWSFWIQSARLGDIVGTTMYKKVWFKELKTYVRYPFPPVFYWRKAQIIKKLFNKEVIAIELQAEPWCSNLIYNCGLAEQEKTMNLEQFRKNIEFAKNTGLKEFYLWGGEWWYWLKEKQGKPEIWNEAEKLFINISR
jgi:hypothetical protein